MSSITLGVNSGKWSAAVDEWLILAADEGHKAGQGGAQAIQRVSREKLGRWHAPYTKTPSGPGEPPASITGQLAASFIVVEDGDDWLVGPTTDYGREQELGGPMHGHAYMNFFWEGEWHHRELVELPARPTLLPATEEVIFTGEITDIYAAHWLIAQEAVT